MARRICAGKRDGTRCSAPTKCGSSFSGHHATLTAPEALPAAAPMEEVARDDRAATHEQPAAEGTRTADEHGAQTKTEGAPPEDRPGWITMAQFLVVWAFYGMHPEQVAPDETAAALAERLFGSSPEEGAASFAKLAAVCDRIKQLEQILEQLPPVEGDTSLASALESAQLAPAWSEAWDAIRTEAVNVARALPTPDLPPAAHGRKGKRLMARRAEQLRVVTAEPVKDALMILGRGNFRPVAGDNAILGEHKGTQVRIECAPDIGFGPERAIHVLARKGPSVVQKFLGLSGLWFTQHGSKPRDTYLEAGATDLLRYMGKKPTSRGGYPADEILACGRNIYLIMNMSIPRAQVTHFDAKGNPTRATLTITRPVVIESITAQLALEPTEPQSIVEFRYHLGSEVYEWLCGNDTPQYATLSGQLLRYHPERQKYHILFGFALGYYDRVNWKNSRYGTRRITLPKLFALAAVEIPKHHVARFFGDVQRAFEELARDQVIPGLQLILPPAGKTAKKQAQMTARDMISASSVAFPSLLGTTRGMDALPEEG
jgi:hypothetical protein